MTPNKQGAQDVISEHKFPAEPTSFNFIQILKIVDVLTLAHHILKMGGQIKPLSPQQLELHGAHGRPLGGAGGGMPSWVPEVRALLSRNLGPQNMSFLLEAHLTSPDRQFP